MPSSCPHCDGPLARERRRPVERLYLARIEACRRCGARVRTFRVPMANAVRFLASRHTHCIQCGTAKVRRLPARDHIDAMSKHPLSLLFQLTLAPIVHCGACRLQYHDWRLPEPLPAVKPAPASPAR
jgi:hypothetical protein